MEVPPAIKEVGGYDQSFPAEEDTDEDEYENLCRICRSPEEPGNPLRFPCLCRGSIRYIHEGCLLRWMTRRGHKKCEVCGRSYSFVPVYSEDAPERLPCMELLIGVSWRVVPYMKLIVSWIFVILFTAYFNSLLPWGQELDAESKSGVWLFQKFASLWKRLLYSFLILEVMALFSLIRGFLVVEIDAGRFPGWFRAENFVGNGLGQGVIGGVVKVLWKYMTILCDWYFHKINHFMEPRLVPDPPNVQLHEFGFIRRMLFFLDDNAFAFLAISVYVPFLFVLLPFLIGWITLAIVGGRDLSETSPVIFGYMVMLSIPLAYFGILFTLRKSSFPAIVQWLLLGFHFVTMQLPCLLWLFSVEACKNLFVIKHAFVLCLKFGVLPWVLGWWLEICTSPLFGTTISQRFEILAELPCILTVRWCSGICCLMIVSSCMELVQEIIQKRAFWYLLDVTDPDYKITELYLGYTFVAYASLGVLLVIFLHLPMKALTLISPSFLPLKLWVTDEEPFIFAIPIYFDIMRFIPEWLINITRPAMEPIVRNWIITVSSWLQLSDFLLVVPPGEGFHRGDQNVRPIVQPRRLDGDSHLFLLYSKAEGSIVVLRGTQNSEDYIKGQREKSFLPRIAMLLVLAALSLFMVGTAFVALPILAGRVFSDAFSFILLLRFGIKHDDLCGFWIGCLILRAIYVGACFAFDHIWRGRTVVLLQYVSIQIRNGLFFSIWITFIPGLLGLLIDLMIIIPSRVPLYESPVYFLIQDWLIGVVVLHIWTFLTMLTPISCFATESWRRKIRRIKDVGINRLPSMWLLREVIGSIIHTLLTMLCIPYLLAKALFPLLGFSLSINSAAERFIWPALLALVTVWFMAKLTRDLIVYLHELVFNERYLVGERLNNLTLEEEDL